MTTSLTPSELRVLTLLCEGRHPKEIAALTGNASSTITTQCLRARRKLGARTTWQAVAMIAMTALDSRYVAFDRRQP